ncbi:hypothetical protein ABEO76_08020 [Bacillus anthracis]
MTNHHEFISLALDCERIIKQNIPSNPEDAKRGSVAKFKKIENGL